MLVYAHRGASAELPENTLEAFARALELGVDALETDVHLTRDGHVVVAHDDDGARMARDPRRVAACSLEELRGWDVGAGFVPRRGGGRPGARFTMPTLEELLEATPGVTLNVDLKARGAVEPVLSLLRRAGAEGRVLLTSFHDDVVAAVRRAGYRGRTGLARNEALRALALPSWAPARLLPHGDRAQLPAALGGLRLASRAVLARLHAHGLRVDYWVVDDPVEARRIDALGADGLMTDDPATILSALGR